MAREHLQLWYRSFVTSVPSVVEDDPSTGPYHVGRGCYPNSAGVVQLDAAIMASKDFRIGAVAGLEGWVATLSLEVFT